MINELDSERVLTAAGARPVMILTYEVGDKVDCGRMAGSDAYY
jgi:hypothetical protein